MTLIVTTPFTQAVPMLPTAVNPTVHFDFSDVSTLWQDTGRTNPITAGGQVISGVTDLSGNSYHAIGTGSGNRHYRTSAQNGLSAIQLNTGITGAPEGDDQIYQNTLPDQGLDNTIFMVCTFPPDSASAAMFWDGFNIVLRQFAFRPGGANNVTIGSNLSVATSITSTQYTWIVLTIKFDGTSTRTYLDGTLIDNGGFAPMGTNAIRHWRLGNSYPATNGLDMYIGEALFYGSTLTNTQIDDINAYLVSKWL